MNPKMVLVSPSSLWSSIQSVMDAACGSRSVSILSKRFLHFCCYCTSSTVLLNFSLPLMSGIFGGVT
jgi:hypothetical protein